MSKSGRGYHRRNVVIDREFQLGFIVRFGGFLMFYLLFFIMVVVVGPVALALLGGESDWAVMEMSFRVDVLLRLVLAPTVCTFLCLFVHGILETFRIAGPNYRFKSVFQHMTALQLPRGVKVRKNDYLQDTAESFNQALVALHKHVELVQGQSQETLRVLQSGNGEQATRQMEELNSSLQRFELMTAAPGCELMNPAGPVEPIEVKSEAVVETESVAS